MKQNKEKMTSTGQAAAAASSAGPQARTKPDSATGTQTAQRIIALLKLLSAHQSAGLKFTEVAEHLGLERPTAHRMLKILNAEGMIFREPSTKRYFLGHLIFQLGLVAAHKFKLHELCAPSLRRLADITHDTAFLFVRAGMEAICIGRIQGDHPIQTPSIPLGGRQPLGVSAGGLALLSALPDQDIENITKANEPYLHEYGGLTRAELSRLVKEARRNNYAVIGERAVPGVTAVGIAIRNPAADYPLASLAVATTTDRMSKARQKEILPILREEAALITELLNQ